MLLNLDPRVLEFFQAHSNHISIKENETYMYYPFWIRVETKEYGIKEVEEISFEKLPEEVVNFIKEIRNEKPSIS